MEFGFFVDRFTFIAGLRFAAVRRPERAGVLRPQPVTIINGATHGQQDDHLPVVRPRQGPRGGRVLRERVPRQPASGKATPPPWTFPSAKEGEELTVEFTVLGQAYIGLNGGPNFKPNEAVSFMVLTENQEETDRYWNAIVGQRRRGKRLRLVQGSLGLLLADHAARAARGDTDPDQAAAKRAIEAMMTMRKIDIATIEAALAGEAR